MFSGLCGEQGNYKNLVCGKWKSGKSGKTIAIISPLDGSVFGHVPAMSMEEADEAIRLARETQKSWRAVPVNKRSEILLRAADILEREADTLANILLREIAKDTKSALSEVTRTADFIRFTADAVKNMTGESIPGDSFPGFDRDKISVVTREPLGVVLAISPFNYPINLAASKIAPAVAAGNTVVVKPATQGSISTLHLARVFEEAGLPAGVLNTMTGRGSEIGDKIVTHPEIDFINFTGSTEVGQHIASLVSMKPYLMELGGKDAAVVLEDCDMDLTVNNIVSGAYSYSGQRCTAVKRILVMESIADEMVKRLKAKIERLSTGNPLEKPDATVVPLINGAAADYVCGLIEDAKQKGAVLVTGGDRNGNLISPALFDKVTTEMRLAWEEPFGPVLPVIRVRSYEEAIAIANKSEYGLQSAVFTQDINKAFYVAERLEVGTVQINNKTERGPDHFPFLGVKSSGLGTQGIKYSIEAMSRPKAIVINLRRS